MKKIMSISLGSGSRDTSLTTRIGDEEFQIIRTGTGGDRKKMRELFLEYDGKVDAFGLGGFDLYIYAGRDKKLPFPEPHKIIKGIKTPVLDGSILKLTLEAMVIKRAVSEGVLDAKGKKAFCLIGTDRFGMAEALAESCGSVIFGDLMASIGLPFPIKKFSSLIRLAKILGPIVVKLPFDWLYPTGEKAEKRDPSLEKYFHAADIIAGDFHYIKKFHPDNMAGKTIITNTTTEENIRELTNTGAKQIITTTPVIGHRTFGTNVMEAVLYTLMGKENPGPDDYSEVVKKLKMDRGAVL